MKNLKHSSIMSDKYRKYVKCGVSAAQDDTVNLHVFTRTEKHPTITYKQALTDQHLNPNGKLKMRVKLAAQVLSHSVAAGMLARISTNEITAEAVVTATLLSKMDNTFDSLNTDSADLKRSKQYSTNFTEKTEHISLFREMKIFFSKIKFVNEWIRTFTAVERLSHNLKNYNIHSVATRRLNQDPLENLFGCIRGHCCSNPNPNIQQFTVGFNDQSH